MTPEEGHAFTLRTVFDSIEKAMAMPPAKPLPPSPRAEIERICREYGRDIPPELSKAIDEFEEDLRLGSAGNRA